jgi:hypothetical protein
MSDELKRIKGLWRSVRRSAIVVLATLVGGYVGFWVAMFWAIPTPSYVLGGGYRMMFAAFVLTPMAAAASGLFAFLMTKVKQKTIRFALCGTVLVPTLATVITDAIISQMQIALVGALGGLAISHMTDPLTPMPNAQNHD